MLFHYTDPQVLDIHEKLPDLYPKHKTTLQQATDENMDHTLLQQQVAT